MKFSICLFVLLSLTHVMAATIQKAATGVDLADGASWMGGVVPTTNDVALIDQAVTNRYFFSANASWQGLKITNQIENFSFSALEGSDAKLSLGSAGIDFGLTNEVSFNLPIEIRSSQEWNQANWRWVNVNAPVTGAPDAALTVRYWFIPRFLKPLTLPGGLHVKSQCMCMQGEASLQEGTATIWNAGALYLRHETPHLFCDLFSSRRVYNGGKLGFGNNSIYDYANPVGTVTIQAGDEILLSGTDAWQSIVQQSGADVVLDGGVISNNWHNLYTGSYTQKTGNAYFEYAARMGWVDASSRNVKRQEVLIDGGKYTARRIHVGAANSWRVPARMTVRAGVVETSPQLYADNDILSAGGFGVGESCAWGGDGDHLTAQPCGSLVIEGGTVITPQIRFGGVNQSWEDYTLSQLLLKGGELQLTSGVGIRSVWATQDEVGGEKTRNFVDATFMGGTVTVAKVSQALVNVPVRLSDLQGGVTVRIPEGKILLVKKPLWGDGSLRKTGAGTLILSGLNSYTGRTTVAEGVLHFGSGVSSMWSASTLNQETGTVVTVWTSSLGTKSYTFGVPVAQSVLGADTTQPELSALTGGASGRVALDFDGAKDALGMTANNATIPFAGANTFSIGMVLLARSAGVSATDWNKATGIIGSSMSNQNNWGIALNDQGVAGAGLQNSTNATLTVWNDQVNLLDGKPHVVIYTCEKGKLLSLNVDGKVVSVTNTLNMSISNTRWLIGANELKHFFNGQIAEMRLFRDEVLSLDRQDEMGILLNRIYGTTYVMSSSTNVSSGEVVSGDASALDSVSLPAVTAAWRGDTLEQQAGEAVTEWKCAEGVNPNWTFTKKLMDAILQHRGVSKETLAPVVSSETMNGHKAVSFNGENMALALTGNAETPIGNGLASNVVMAVVFRPRQAGKVLAGMDNVCATTGLLGSQPDFDYWAGKSFPTIGFTASGSLVGGVSHLLQAENRVGSVERRSRSGFLQDDGKPHVAVLQVSVSGCNKVSMNVDGYRLAFEAQTDIPPLGRTRILLGVSEFQAKFDSFFGGEVAEFRFYRNVSFTEAQEEVLIRELSATYGADPRGYLGLKSENRLSSREVFVAAGAAVETETGDQLVAAPGQLWRGLGTVRTDLILKDEAGLVISETDGLTMDSLTLGDQARIVVESNQARPIVVADKLSCVDGTITVSIPEGMRFVKPLSLLEWEGTSENLSRANFVLENATGATKCVVDEARKQIYLRTDDGMIFFLR